MIGQKEIKSNNLDWKWRERQRGEKRRSKGNGSKNTMKWKYSVRDNEIGRKRKIK